MNTSTLSAFAAAVIGAVLVMFVSSLILKPRPSGDVVGYVLPPPAAPAPAAKPAEPAPAAKPAEAAKAEAPKTDAAKPAEPAKTAEAPKTDAAKPAPAPAPAPAAKDAAGSAPAPAAAAGFDAKAVAALVSKAKPEDGAAVFKKCATCHVAKKDAPSTAGPNLWGIVGRAKAGQADFAAKYSEAMKGKGGNWGYEELAAFIYKPKEYVPGTKMLFAGIPANADIAALIAYLRVQADTPAALPN